MSQLLRPAVVPTTVLTPSAASRSMFSTDRVRRGELDRDIDALEVLRVSPSKLALLYSSSFGPTSIAELGRKLIDQPAHLAVADEGDFHAANTAVSGFAEEFGVQALHCFLEILLRNDNTQVQQRCALRDHADVDIAQRREHAARDPGRVPDVIADQADNRLIFFDRYIGELLAARAQMSFSRDGLSMVRETLTSVVATMSTDVS